MRVEITERKLKDCGYNLVDGDILTVPDEVGAAWCGHGWAKDVDGMMPTGQRIVHGATLQPAKARHAVTAKEVGNG
jgi:hypothetical protein